MTKIILKTLLYIFTLIVVVEFWLLGFRLWMLIGAVMNGGVKC